MAGVLTRKKISPIPCGTQPPGEAPFTPLFVCLLCWMLPAARSTAESRQLARFPLSLRSWGWRGKTLASARLLGSVGFPEFGMGNGFLQSRSAQLRAPPVAEEISFLCHLSSIKESNYLCWGKGAEGAERETWWAVQHSPKMKAEHWRGVAEFAPWWVFSLPQSTLTAFTA